MSPIVAVGSLQTGETLPVERAINAGGELLKPRKQRMPPDQRRWNLDQRRTRIGVHQAKKPDERLARHQAVCIKHHHVVVGRAPIFAELTNVAALAAAVRRPVAIIDTAGRETAQGAEYFRFG